MRWSTPHAVSAPPVTLFYGPVLSLIDVSLAASLVLMVMFAGYENFVSRFDLVRHKYKPAWMGHVDFGDLKLKLMTSIVAIAAIHVLEGFMNIGQMSDREWPGASASP